MDWDHRPFSFQQRTTYWNDNWNYWINIHDQ